MIVMDGEFNDAGIRRSLDTKFPSIMHKPTATNFMFRDKAKCNIQNPMLGTLYNQLLTKKQKEQLELDAIGKAPSVKDIDIQKRLDGISKFNLGMKDDDDNDDDDDDNNATGRRLPSFPPTPPSTPSTLSETQGFLLDSADGGNERIAEAIGLTATSTPTAKQITFSDTITKVFPKTRREISREPMLESIDEIDEIDDFDASSVEGGLKDRNEPIDLDFFCGGEKINKNYLKMQQRILVY